MGGRGAKAGKGGAVKTEADIERELAEHFQKVNEAVDQFMKSKPGSNLEDFQGQGMELNHVEKRTVKDLVSSYLTEFNNNRQSTGDGFAYWDEDETVSILYRDGKMITLHPQWWDGSKKVPTSGVDSIIVEGGWGTAFAGKSIKLWNYREEVPVGKYGYSSLKKKYDDFDDIRVEFNGQ